MMATVSIIIPILNEAKNLPHLFAHIQRLNPSPRQVILVDGGSNDDSYALAKRLILELKQDQQREVDWQIVTSKVGRAAQMNTGAALASGDVLVFLHADTQLPVDAMTSVLRALSDATDATWGRFDVCLDSDTLMLKIVGHMISIRSRLSKIATGDQAIFIKNDLFKQIGGYANQPLMEDIELCKRLKGVAKPACLTSKVITSARRWQQQGTWRTIILMWQLRFDYWRGVSAQSLKARYYK